MLERDAIVKQYCLALERGKKRTEPFIINEYSPFSDAVYDEILKHIPENDSSYWRATHPDSIRPDGTHTRYLLPLTRERLANVSAETREFWLELASILACEEIRDAFKAQLEPDLKRRWTDHALSDIVALPKPCLLRDYPGYKISIHPDSPTKVMTVQHYLVPDGAQRHMGTGFYGPSAASGKLEKMYQTEYVPNNAYCFAVTKTSYHGVDQLEEGERARNSLMMIYFKEEGHEY